MSEYKEKYFKYKNKYNELKNQALNMKGGIIGQIESDRIDTIKSDEEIPEIIKNYIKIITIPDTKVIRVGSAMLKIQPYFSDINVMNIIHKQVSSDKLVKFFIANLKNLLKTIIEIPNLFFSDFKAGGLHWTVDQIMEEKHNQLSLYDACFIKDVIKLDIIGPYDERYLEMSTFFILKSSSEYINVETDYFESFKKSLLKDISHYQESKPFKALKRVWSLARITNDSTTMKLLKDIIKSNISLLGQINADIESIILLIEHESKYDTEFIFNELDGFREKLSTIIDIKLDYEKINLMIDNIKLLFKFGKDQNFNESNVLIENLTRLHNYLLKVINKETFDYLESIKFKFPVSQFDNDNDNDNDTQTNYEETEILDII
jgi:hypothetical protein